MNLAKARERQQEDLGEVKSDFGLLCRMPGCKKRWTVDVNHGRVCSVHDAVLSRCGQPLLVARSKPLMVPLRQAVKPYVEVSDRDEEF